MNNTLEYITSITLLIALITGIISTIVVIVDYHKYWRNIWKYWKK